MMVYSYGRLSRLVHGEERREGDRDWVHQGQWRFESSFVYASGSRERHRSVKYHMCSKLKTDCAFLNFEWTWYLFFEW